ncbi:hypothetical protein F0Q45_25305 [Mycobacterium simiae]|uniref:Uncharacterized protein n=1 Tax=Mycobacterium simiae TaxID=1784 RepID=A0A5B1B989_MYCSI|nr:hypothetical protein F0Q45_25305 [Mycobacterium simiae]
MAADTSSAPAASTPVVGAAAPALAALIVDPMLARSPAAAAKISGDETTNDIARLSDRNLAGPVVNLDSHEIYPYIAWK